MESRTRIFTAPEHIFDSIAECVARNGDIDLLSDRWVIGLDVGHRLFEEFAGMENEVTGRCRVVRAFNAFVNGRKVTLIASAGGGVYTEGLLGLAS